jgi:transcriptional regulator with XRE-family HTH domain
MSPIDHLKDKVTALRNAKRWKQKDLAENLGMKPPQLSLYLQQDMQPEEYINKICKLFDIEEVDLRKPLDEFKKYLTMLESRKNQSTWQAFIAGFPDTQDNLSLRDPHRLCVEDDKYSVGQRVYVELKLEKLNDEWQAQLKKGAHLLLVNTRGGYVDRLCPDAHPLLLKKTKLTEKLLTFPSNAPLQLLKIEEPKGLQILTALLTEKSLLPSLGQSTGSRRKLLLDLDTTEIMPVLDELVKSLIPNGTGRYGHWTLLKYSYEVI